MSLAKQTAGVLIAVTVALGVHWYVAPLLTLRMMLSAAQAGDVERFDVHVDYRKLRASLKRQFLTQMAARPPQRGEPDEGGARAAAARTFETALVSAMVDATVQPELVMLSLVERPLSSDPSPPKPGAATARMGWTLERAGLDRVVVHLRASRDGGRGDAPEFVLERAGLVSWKLSEIRLPSSGEDKLAELSS